jgi:DNA-binding XRE family transcriptional regulator
MGSPIMRAARTHEDCAGSLCTGNAGSFAILQMRKWQAVLGRNVRRLRQQRDMTQEQLAFDAQIDLTYLGGIERGKRNPSLLVMARIGKALSVSLPKLLSE